MKFGLIPVNIGVTAPGQLFAIARTAEDAGYESVWTFEHVIVPVDYQSKYPYATSGKMGVAPETLFIDPLIALTAVAAQTKSIRLGTGVNIVAQTNPMLLAKQATSLEFIPNGRSMLGAGIGRLWEEFVAIGTPFGRRGVQFDDHMVAMKKVLSGEMVEHDRDLLTWRGFKSYRLPVQRPGVSIHLGGRAGRAAGHAGRF